MIVTMYGIIVFQLVERIAYKKKTAVAAISCAEDIVLFPHAAIRTRHEIPQKPYSQEEYYENELSKLLSIADMAD